MKLAPEFDHIKNSQFFVLHMCGKLLDIFSSFWFSDERTIFFSLNPGLSTCQKRFEESFLFPPLGRFVPSCKDDGRFQERQCHPSTGHCWCVDSYGTELLGTRTRGRPNCTAPGNTYITCNLYYQGCALRRIKCSPVLWNCEIQGDQHK